MAGKSNKPAKRQEGQQLKRVAGPLDIRPSSIGLDLNALNESSDFDPVTRRFLVAQQTTMSVSGPLPSSGEFAGYNQTLPGAADRILTMAEVEQKARLAENQRRLTHDGWNLISNTVSRLIGQGVAGGLVFYALQCSYDLAMHEHTTAAISITGTAIGAILAAFLGAKIGNSNSKEKPTEEPK